MELFGQRPELVLLLGGMLLLIFILRKRAGSHFRRTVRAGADRAVGVSVAASPTNSADASPDIARWEVHLHETARELTAQLDSKMVALQHLIRQAREEQGRLQHLLQSQGREHDTQ